MSELEDDEALYFDTDLLEDEDCHQCGYCLDCTLATQRYFEDQRQQETERVLGRLQDVLTQHGMRDKLDDDVRQSLLAVLFEELP